MIATGHPERARRRLLRGRRRVARALALRLRHGTDNRHRVDRRGKQWRRGTRVLVIDNYDSFVYNLVQYLGELGAEPIVHRHDAITLDEMDALAPDAVLDLARPGASRRRRACRTTRSGTSASAASPCSACASACSASASCTAATSCARRT